MGHRMGWEMPSLLGTELRSMHSEWQTRHPEADQTRVGFEAVASALSCVTRTTPASAAVTWAWPALFRRELSLCSLWGG